MSALNSCQTLMSLAHSLLLKFSNYMSSLSHQHNFQLGPTCGSSVSLSCITSPHSCFNILGGNRQEISWKDFTQTSGVVMFCIWDADKDDITTIEQDPVTIKVPQPILHAATVPKLLVSANMASSHSVIQPAPIQVFSMLHLYSSNMYWYLFSHLTVAETGSKCQSQASSTAWLPWSDAGFRCRRGCKWGGGYWFD